MDRAQTRGHDPGRLGRSRCPLSAVIHRHHAHLLTSGMRGIFEVFRKEVLALDPCVAEEFKKLYVAYKAETNFVDVVPQANGSC